MRKHYFFFSILVLSLSLGLPQTVRGQQPSCMPNSNIKPSNYVPFSSIYYISAPGTTGDLLVVGSMTQANFGALSAYPTPNNTNQQFCNPITLAPGIVANAYVPTAQERTGDFGSAFSSVLFNPNICDGCAVFSGGTIPINPWPGVFALRIPPTQPGPTVYVSTGSDGNQILAVDGSSGVTSVLYTPSGESGYYDLEGLAVGPDNLIYITDPSDNEIFRLPQTTGGTLQTIYQYSEGSGPDQVQGPSFSTTGLLTFNTEDNQGVWQIGFNSSDNASAPVQVIPPTYGAIEGAGTTFNLSDELLIVDECVGEGCGGGGGQNDVLQQTAPGANTTTPLITSDMYAPIGVAVNSSGNIFVSNLNNYPYSYYSSAGYIAQYDSKGNYLSNYVTFNCFGEDGPCDTPAYMQFDASGRLYVVTAQDSYGDYGKVWRVGPCGTPPCTPTLLIDLNYAYSNSTVPGLYWNSAVGVALAGTGTTNSYTTPPLPITPGVPVTYSYGNIANQTITIPTGSNLGGAASIAVDFQLWNPSLFDTTRLPATSTNTWSGGTPVQPGTTCTPIEGTGGNCIVIEDLCFDSSGDPILPCNIQAPSGSLIDLMSMYQTLSPQPNPGLIIGSDGGLDWANITTGYSPGDTSISGGTRAVNTDTAIVNLGLGIVSPSSLEFGTVYLATITIKSVTVNNYGNAPMTITEPLIWPLSGGDSKEFAAVNLCPKSLAPATSCTIDVVFLAGPNYAPQSAILSVVDSDPSSPQSIFVSGLVINPVATLSSYRLNFGKQGHGTTSAPEGVKLTNTGATPLALSTLTASGNFALDPSTTCANGETLAPRASCMIDVTFTPTTTGAQSGSVVITDNARNSPQTIWLSGMGI